MNIGRERVREKAMERAMESIRDRVSLIRTGQSDLARISNLLILFVSEYPEKKTAKGFMDWIMFDIPKWMIWSPLHGIRSKGMILEFIDEWIDKEDVPLFMDYIKRHDERMYEFLINPEIPEEELY